MKNIFRKMFVLFILPISLLSITGCLSSGDKESTLSDITGLSFDNKVVDYNGEEHKIEVSGDNVDSYNITYTSNSGTNAGVYNATATIKKDNYNTLTLSASLTINGLDITGVTFESTAFDYDGTTKLLEVSGTIPSGVSVVYENNTASETGVYSATATLSGKNYNTLVLNASLTINAVTGENITGFSISNKTVTYNEQTHSIELTGDTTGHTIIQENNEHVNVGIYTVAYIISKEGFIPLRLEATLTIEKATISNVSFEDTNVTYDGNEKYILVNGTIPTDVSVSYSNNKGTNANTYNATATLSGSNYNTLVLNATLTINKATITGVTFDNYSVTEDGNDHEILISGVVPGGVSVSYSNNKGSNSGIYNATATLSGDNYNTLVLEATMTIKVDSSRIIELLQMVTNTPDPFSYLPEAFGLDERYDSFGTINQLTYTSSVYTNLINKGAIGLQMNVLYDTLLQNETLLSYVSTVNLSLSAITIAYQNFINNNPEDYAEFEDTEGNLQYKIILDNNNVKMLVKISGVYLELEYDKDSETNTIRLQLTDSNALKLESSESKLIISTNILNLLTSTLILEEIDGFTQGVLYEFTNVLATDLKTTSFITVSENYTTVTCNKREGSNIMPVDAFVEVYSNTTGVYLGAEAKESVSLVTYNTFWFHLADVGITSIQITDGTKNPGDDLEGLVYANGVEFNAVYNTKFSVKTSRKFDIEYKSFYAYNYNSDTDGYDKVELIIPMIFVQEGDNLDDFVSDMSSENKIDVYVPSQNTIINSYYNVLVDLYEKISDVTTKDDVIAYIGTKDEFFNS